MDKLSNLICNIYSLLLLVGGFMGYFKAHSKASLCMGLLSSILIFLSVKVGMKNFRAGYLFSASITLVLAMFFSLKFAATHTLFPHGIMLIFSTFTYVTVARGWIKNK